MCGDEGMLMDDEPVDPPSSVSRRRFLQAMGVAAAATVVGPASWESNAAAAAVAGTKPVSMAMHIHASFSEQWGSMEGQLHQAQQNAVDVLWWTDHDHRMSAFGYRRVVHFTSLTNEQTDGPPWHWERRDSGPLTAGSNGGIVTSPASPHDPIAGGSLTVNADSSTSGTASLGFYAQAKPAAWNYHGNLYGQTLTVDVLPTTISHDGYLELLLNISSHLPHGGRPGARYTLSYRFGGPGAPGTRTANGVNGVVYVGVSPGTWNTVSMTPCDDIAALWPDLEAHDFASYGLTLSAVSSGAPARGNFDYLRFARAHTSGDVPLQTQKALQARYAGRFPKVTQRQGLEVSLSLPHVNWFGGAVSLPDYTGITYKNYDTFVAKQITKIHAAGGLASYNHPFGYSGGHAMSPSAQASLRAHIAAKLLSDHALHCDILEVGYPLRGGVDLAHHVELWDVLSRNARFMTGNGTSDDHFAQNWLGIKNNWYTSTWSPSVGEHDLLGALRAGRAWTASLSRFRGSLDLLADGGCAMGSASVSGAANRKLRVSATGIPSGGSVKVVRGKVDYAGTAAPDPNTATIASFSAGQLGGGSVSLSVDTKSSAFVRTQVLDSHGSVVALSNPIWLLRKAPPGGIPAARAC